MNSMTHKDLDGNKVNTNRARYQMFLYPGFNNPWNSAFYEEWNCSMCLM